MRRLVFALTFVAIPAATALTMAQSARADVRGVDVEALDRKADPCVDFYQFACGGWVAKNPVPADRRSYGRITEVQERNLAILRRILETPGADGDRAKAAGYYAACMDESKIEAEGLSPVASELATIEELVNPDDLPVLAAHLHAMGVPALFRFGAQTDVLGDPTQQIADLDQGGLSLPDREYYLKTDDRSVDLRKKFAATIEKISALAGAPADRASADANAVLSIETALATASLERVQRRDPKNTLHTMALNDLQATTPNFSWRKYGASAEAPKFQVLNVAVPDYFKALDRLVGSSSSTGSAIPTRGATTRASASRATMRSGTASGRWRSAARGRWPKSGSRSIAANGA